MDQIPVPETRRRSRSKTPFVLRSQCDKENCTEEDHLHGPVKKNPTVQTITEEHEQSPAIAVSTSSSSSSSGRTSSRTTKVTSGDKTTVDQVTVSTVTKSAVVVVTQTTESPTKTRSSVISNAISVASNKVAQNSNEPTASTSASVDGQVKQVKSKRSTRLTKEATQNEINQDFEENSKIRSSTPIMTQSNTKMFTSPLSSNGDLSDHAPYREYKEAGEYWNKYPKTDYTYSKLSPHRRELAPGMVAMPNMSRQSLEQHHDRVETMALHNPSQESYIRARYQAMNYPRVQRTQREVYYDSQDEIDLSEFDKKRYMSYSTNIGQKSIVRRFFTLIYSIWERFVSMFSRSESNLYYTRIDEEKGFLRKITSSISSAIQTIFCYIYLFISTILFFDSWLLKASNAENTNKKRFLLFLLILLPLLLLAAWNLADEKERSALISRIPARMPLGIPMALTSFGSFFYEFSNRLKYQHSDNNQPNLNNFHMTDEQYKNLLQHIDGYIDSSIIEKMKNLKETIVTKDLNILIANIVRENIVHHHYKLSDEEIERIVKIVQLRLQDEFQPERKIETPFEFAPSHIEEIVKIVNANIKQLLDHQEPSKSVDVESILLVLLASPKLADLIDQRILSQITPDRKVVNSQKQSIDSLNVEIQSIKDKLVGKQKENQQLQYSLEVLENHQKNLVDQLNGLQNGFNEKIEKILADVDIKLSDLNSKQFAAIDERVKMILLDIMGYAGSKKDGLDSVDIKNWIYSVFVSKEMLEGRLNALKLSTDEQMKNELNLSAGILMKDINERIKMEVLNSAGNSNYKYEQNGNFDAEAIRKIVQEALAVYDADKTGLVDYALETAGGEVLSTRCTENYQTKSAQLSIFGIPLWYQTNTPRTAISPAVQPGQCWAFQGFPGFLVLKLNCNVLVTGFTLEHIPKSLAPKGRIDSAPKMFTVWGLDNESDHEPVNFGKYEYLENGTSLQYFRIQNQDNKRAFNIVELRIESNHGNLNYTCLYRFRVHGIPQT